MVDTSHSQVFQAPCNLAPALILAYANAPGFFVGGGGGIGMPSAITIAAPGFFVGGGGIGIPSATGAVLRPVGVAGR
jgi:hypothetical protein